MIEIFSGIPWPLISVRYMEMKKKYRHCDSKGDNGTERERL